MTVGEYIRTRFTTLKPAMKPVRNPIAVMRLLNKEQWLFFIAGFLAWMWDALDFFTVSLTIAPLSAAFGRPPADITWGITCSLMTRSVGAIIFGVIADRYGRKPPYVICCTLFIILELATGFCNTYGQFIAVRALYGVAMGGMYGTAAITALDDCPPEARGIMAGIYQQAYSVGYLLATVFARGLVDTTPHGWRPLYWFAACPPILLIAFRLWLPETQAYKRRLAVREEAGGAGGTYVKEGKVAIKRHWLLFGYLVLLLTGMNFSSHGSSDLYPTFTGTQLGFSKNAVTVTQVVANLGAVTGGIFFGHVSSIIGRRLSLIITCIIAGAFLYPYCFMRSKAIIAPAFFELFGVQGGWGIIPSHMIELSPPGLATFFVGTTYQLGNLISSASTTIEATAAEQFPLPPRGTTKRYDYGLVIAILMGAVLGYIVLLTFIGPERLGQSTDIEDDTDMDEVAGHDLIARTLHRDQQHHDHHARRSPDEISEEGRSSGEQRVAEKV
ncbi:major facilitator superfamily domain-containing protein [Elsinoe ampelina]|uniref:Major facilitator superfamily domain-containing protein n=1 Tax=Elsinoe ampelina TaxID=302913 RepID=A0A6A6GPP0_9PEZI|nr:major facilitator superfamily domain-containing protein [Elsinoe ampelina]